MPSVGAVAGARRAVELDLGILGFEIQLFFAKGLEAQKAVECHPGRPDEVCVVKVGEDVQIRKLLLQLQEDWV
jgi:hypothetical protein